MLLHPNHEVILNLRVLDGLKQHAEACRLGNEGERGNRDEEDDFATSPLLLVSPILLLSACVWCTRCTQKASGDLSVLRTQSEKHTFSCCVTPQCVTKSRIRANSHPSWAHVSSLLLYWWHIACIAADVVGWLLAVKMSKEGRATRATEPFDPSDPKAMSRAVKSKMKKRKKKEYLVRKERGLPKKSPKK